MSLPPGWRLDDDATSPQPAPLPKGWTVIDDTQSDIKDYGNAFVQGIADQGIGAAVEGTTRVAGGGVAGLAQAAADVGAGLGVTKRGDLEWRLRELRMAEDVIWSRKEGPWAKPGYTFSEEENRRLDAIKAEIASLETQRETTRINPTAAAIASTTKQAAEGVGRARQAVRETFPVDADVQQRLPAQVISGVGQAVGQIPMYLAGMGLPASIGQLYDQGYQEAKQAGADEATAATAGIANMPSSVLEYAADRVQLSWLFKAMRAGKVTRQQFVKELLAKGVQSFVAEGSTEGAQQAWQNFIASKSYAPNRSMTEGVGESMLVGGLTGAAVSTGVGAVDRMLTRGGGRTDDTGQNIQESKTTLLIQQRGLIEGTVPAQMFPKGTTELPLPEGFARTETPRGVFHFDPDQISAEEIAQISKARRENEILGLGPASKADVEARAAAGEPIIAMRAKMPDGTEARTALATPSTAAVAGAALERSTPGAIITPGPVAQTFVDRLRAKDQEAATAEAEAAARERAAREERQKALAAKRDRFDEIIQIARETAKDPSDYARTKGALESVRSYAEDNSLGLTLEQKQIAERATSILQGQFEQLEKAEETRRAQAVETARKEEAARLEAQQKKIAAARADFEKQKAAGIGADGNLDYARLSEDQLAALAQDGDVKALREFERRELEPDQPVKPKTSFLEVLRQIGLPRIDKALAGELKLLLQEEMTPAQRRTFINSRRGSLDEVAQVLREDYGFSSITTPDAVIETARRALRGEEIQPDTTGGEEISFSARSEAGTDNVSEAQLDQTLQETEIPSDPIETERSARAKQARSNFLAAGPVILKDIGQPLRWAGNATDHARQAPKPEDKAAWANAALLIRNAVPIGALEPDNMGRSNIEGYRRYIAVAKFNGRRHVFRITVRKNRQEGWQLHEIFRPNLEGDRPPGTAQIRAESAAKSLKAADHQTFKVRDLVDIVKSKQDGTYSIRFLDKQNPSSPAPTELQIAAWEQRIRKRFPKVFKEIDLEIGLLESSLRKRGFEGKVPQTAQAALLRLRGQKATIVLAAKAITSDKAATRLTMHELGHAYWDNLSEGSKEILRDMHEQEVRTKTGPLYAAGRLKHPVAWVEEITERGHQEWFAERIAEENYRWASTGITGSGFVQRIADALRSIIQKVAAVIWGTDPESDLFRRQFRDWMRAGADARIATKSSIKFAASKGPSSRAKRELEQQLAALREGADQSDPAEIEAKGAAIQAQIRALEATPDPETKASDDQVAASLVNLEEVDQKSDWLPTATELDEEETRIAEERAKAIPKVDPKQALIAQWQRGKDLRDRGLRQNDETAIDEGQRIVSATKRTLDLKYPEWQDEVEKKPAAKPPAPPPPPNEPSGALPGDEEPSPFEKSEDAPEPDRGRAKRVMGQTAQDVPWYARTWKSIEEWIRGFKGSLPELPTFPDAQWNREESFIKRFGPRFYDRMKLGIRQLRNANDYIQRTAEEQLRAVAEPLLALGEQIGKSGYRRFQDLAAAERRAEVAGRKLDPKVQAELDALRSKLESHPYYLFSEIVVFLDLNWRRNNLKDSRGNSIAVPGGLNSKEIENELNRLGGLLAASEHRQAIESAIERHMKLVASVASDLKSRDLAAADQLKNPYYFPHLTLEKVDPMDDKKVIPRELTVERVKVSPDADFRGYLIDPVGSPKPIETDYIKAMYYHLVQVGAHNARADTVQNFIRPYDVMKELEAEAKALSKQRGYAVSWEAVFHEQYSKNGYVIYGMDSGDAFTSIQIDREKLAKRLGVMLTQGDIQAQLKELGVKGIKILPEDVREVLSAGAKETWILPAPVAETLRKLQVEDQQKDGPAAKLLRLNTSAWKYWKLFMPWNMIRYNFGNLVADVEKLITVDPAVFLEIGPAFREVRSLFNRETNLSKEMTQALRLGVVNSVTAQEMGQLNAMQPFRAFETKAERFGRIAKENVSTLGIASMLKSIGLQSMDSVQLSAVREAVFRYAKFRADVKRIEHNARPKYAGAFWKEIEAIKDSAPGADDAKYIKAAEISLKTFGDYSDLSKTGKQVRDQLIPFYSWTEVNLKYHANLFRNLKDMIRAAEVSKTDKAKAGSLVVAATLARLAIPYIAVALWNSATEMEDELSEEDRRRFHIIVGRDADGRPMLITAPTAFLDVVKWFSGAEFMRQMADVMNGRTDLPTATGAWLSQIGPDLANNTIGQAGPAIRIPYTIVSKKSAFPDITDQRSIPAYDMPRVVIAQATDDFTADLIMRMVDKEYLAPKDLGDWATQLILQVRKRDPEQWAFYEIKDKAADWVAERTGVTRGSSGAEAKHLQALRNFKKSIYRGDLANAERFYNVLLDYGYTAEQFQASIRAQDPLAEIPKAMRREFVNQLADHERAQLERAYQFYSKISSARGQERMLFPSKKTDPQKREAWRPRIDLLQELGQEDEQRADLDLMKALRN